MRYLFFVVATTILLYQYTDAVPWTSDPVAPTSNTVSNSTASLPPIVTNLPLLPSSLPSIPSSSSTTSAINSTPSPLPASASTTSHNRNDVIDPESPSEPPPPPYIQPSPYSPSVPSTPPTVYTEAYGGVPDTPVDSSTSDSSDTRDSSDSVVPLPKPENDVVFNPVDNLPLAGFVPIDFASKFDGILQELNQIATVPETYFGDALVNHIINTKEEIFKQIANQEDIMKDAINKQTGLTKAKKDELTESYHKVLKEALDRINASTVQNTKASIDLFESLEIAKVANQLAATIKGIMDEQLAVAIRLAQIPSIVLKDIQDATEPIRQITKKFEADLKLNTT